MKRARKCRKCGCTERKACIEFDSKGRGYGCRWSRIDDDGYLCTGCDVEGPAFFRKLYDLPSKPFVVAPQLAGYVARSRK